MESKSICEFISYNKDTGIFTSLKTRGNVKKGSVIGNDKGDGYLQANINKKTYLLHRLAFFICYGYWPQYVDHINGVRNDNRICNLREVNLLQNARNSSKKAGTSRFKGVSFRKRDNIWVSGICDGNKIVHLGRFKDEVEAAYKYDLASISIHGEYGKRNFLPLV